MIITRPWWCYCAVQEGGVGLKGPLIDREGYPRSDIDIYAVRTARQKVLCLQNDHKALMKLIESKLHDLHAQERVGDELPSNQTARLAKPFITVNEVTVGSPAESAVRISIMKYDKLF